MLHQEKVQTLTLSIPMLLGTIQTILLVARALLDMTLMIPMVHQERDQNSIIKTLMLPDLIQTILLVVKALLDAKALMDMTLMIPMLQQDLVQNSIPKTPMLLDTIQMILMDAKVLLDMTLILHQEKVPTLTPTIPMLPDMIPMLLDMIPMIPMDARVHLDMTPVIPMLHQGKVPISTPTTPMLLDMIPMIPMVAKVHLGLIPMILTQEKAPNTTLTILMLHIARDPVIPMELDHEKGQAMIPIQLVVKVQTTMITNAVVMVKISMTKSLELVAKIVRMLDNVKEAVEVPVVSEVAMKIQVATTQLVSLEPETEVEKAVVVKEAQTNQERVRLTYPDQNVLSILWVAKERTLLVIVLIQWVVQVVNLVAIIPSILSN